MGQRRSWTKDLASDWQCQLWIAALVFVAASATGEIPHGKGPQGPDTATMFNVQGRKFWNKSLGLDQLPHGVLGHQCSAARPDPHPTHTFTYTPNRRWPKNAADGRSAIVMAVGGEPERFYERLSVTWESWQGYFTPAVRRNTVLILLLDANFWTDLTKLIEHMDAKPLDCDKRWNRHACDVAARLDQGYKLYILDVFLKFTPGAVPVVEPMEPFVIFVGIKKFPHPFWIDRRKQTEAEVLTSGWRTDHCNHANYAYTKFTNWYSFHMFDELRILDFFDFWWKIDDDVRWFKPLPLDLTAQLVEERRIFFHTAIDFDPWWCIGPNLGESIKLFMEIESDFCGRDLRAVAHDKVWWQNDSYIYLSEFVGGWLGMYTSPELMEYGRIWNYYPYAMWTWRWGDQQFWTKANGLFDNGSGILDLSYLKQPDTSVKVPADNVDMMFYHG